MLISIKSDFGGVGARMRGGYEVVSRWLHWLDQVDEPERTSDFFKCFTFQVQKTLSCLNFAKTWRILGRMKKSRNSQDEGVKIEEVKMKKSRS